MHDVFMKEALNLAERGIYGVHPNPMVGCVIVKNGHIIGRGWHKQYGEAHAEIHALTEAGPNAKDASVYVTLEPCNHFGKTPPCTDALIAAQVNEVFIACLDPNPLVAGQGIAKLHANGIQTHIGLCAESATALNRSFFHYITTKTPYVIAKWAMSLDGKMSVQVGDSPILSSEESAKNLHERRAQIPAILIGAGTARKDNPSLTVRLVKSVLRQPQRIVLNTEADLPTHLKLFDGSLPGQTWLICGKAYYQEALQKFSPASTRIFPCKTQHNTIDLLSLLQLLGEQEISALLLEGGPNLLTAFFNQNLVNEVEVYLTPWIIADLPHKIQLKQVKSIHLGPDVKMTGQIRRIK